jgi:flavin-dependent dehydrogenase
MSIKYVDIIIIGSGMAGLYSAYNIKKTSPNTSFLVLEKHEKIENKHSLHESITNYFDKWSKADNKTNSWSVSL